MPLGPDHPVLGLRILVKATVAWIRPSVVWRQDSLALPDLRDPEHPLGSRDKQPVLSWSLPHAVCKLHPCGKHIPEMGISVADAKRIFRNALALSQAGSDFSERNMVLTFLVAQLLQAGFPLLHDGVKMGGCRTDESQLRQLQLGLLPGWRLTRMQAGSPLGQFNTITPGVMENMEHLKPQETC